MKRSYMLLKIKEILVEQGGMTLDEAAEDLLNRLEGAGMAAPYVETKLWNRQDNEFYKTREWEEESLPADDKPVGST